MALLLGAFTLLNVLGELRNPGFDANLWWIDLRFANSLLVRIAMFVTGLLLVVFGVRPTFAPLRGWGLRSWLCLLVLVAAFNSWTFLCLVSTGGIRSGFPLPLSGAMVIVLTALFWAVGHRELARRSRGIDRGVCLLAIVAASILFPLAQMYCFGRTDYRRQADVIVVFGCLVRADGTPSMALADRVRTGVDLYQARLANRLIFSGGPGEGPTHETEAMRRLAIQLGVPATAIEIDLDGLNTQATVSNVIARDWGDGRPRVLAVSHFYHLPRIKLCFRRAGWDVLTVPANESRELYYLPRYLMREIVALWWYYLNPV
jgi:uncharacterized SAM-binding protein YcdF (DUF218 family)